MNETANMVLKKKYVLKQRKALKNNASILENYLSELEIKIFYNVNSFKNIVRH